MELTFVPKAESGWRGRGAPPVQVPDEVLDLLRRTDGTGEVGVVDTTGDSTDEVKELLRMLRLGAKRLQRRINIQRDPGQRAIRFQLSPLRKDPR